ncbi:TonB-dependent receptor domain-containing protein [Hymenobacter humi]|uniref:TonB-dependent receptor domain-containing protein n=1 Tax=Hymenobacter humi TaxID=1411620 RepID=A0ABW2U9I1_9BACT
MSFFGKATYSFKERYTADVSVRADASSRFGSENRWGYFPAVGLGWRLGEESFIQDLGVFQELKLRASLGKTGNQAGISDFAALGLVQGGANYLDLPGTSPLQLANPNLSWESTRQWNVGLDAGVLQNRLVLELNYYDKYTSGLLLNVPVPRKTGFSSLVENYGAVSNKGFEAQATANWLPKGALQWSTTVNIARNVNKIEKLAAPITTGSRDIFRLEEGASLYSFWLYHQTRVNPESGNAEYEDVNGDGQLTVADRKLVGNAWPDYFGGVTNSITYKGLDFGFTLNFEQGAKIMNMNRFFLVHGGTQSNIGYLSEQARALAAAGRCDRHPAPDHQRQQQQLRRRGTKPERPVPRGRLLRAPAYPHAGLHRARRHHRQSASELAARVRAGGQPLHHHALFRPRPGSKLAERREQHQKLRLGHGAPAAHPAGGRHGRILSPYFR